MDELKAVNKAINAIKQRTPAHIVFSKSTELVIKRNAPILLVYRIPETGKDPLLAELAKSGECYLIGYENEVNFNKLIKAITKRLIDDFGGCLLVELTQQQNMDSDVTVHIAQKTALNPAERLLSSLENEKDQLFISADLQRETKRSKSSKPPFKGFELVEDLQQLTCLGISIAPQYLDSITGSIYPLLFRSFRDVISKSIYKSFLEFVRLHTNTNISQFTVLPHTELQDLVWEIDTKLALESQKFDFLLLVSPINEEEAWLKFKKDKFLKPPKFRYRPMPIDPELVKRNLYNLPIEDLSDPTLAYLFRDKRKELDAMMTMLIDRGNEGFLLGSQQVFGNVSKKLLEIAKALLVVYESPIVRKTPATERINAWEFAKLAEEELAYLKLQLPSLETSVRVRDDISGVMVSRGVLNISKHYEIERRRAMALIQHEVGTHIVTYFNGKSQPFKLFSLGVPGYEELQEGVAVFSEYLVGGLTPGRIRILAARVIAVWHMLGGASFSDTFFLLVDEYGFQEKSAFHITMRVYRAGGLTKDAIYLRGLLALLNYIREGNDLLPLLMGKIRADYIPVVNELTQRKLLREPLLKPRYLNDEYIQNIEKIRKGKEGLFNLF